MTNPARKELASERATAGSRTYFFDIKQATDGTKYLVISESRRTGEDWKHNRVMVFEEHLGAFIDAFDKAVEALGIERKASSIDIIREKHPRAYEPWSDDEDDRLKTCFDAGFEILELARVFKRQEGAIRLRLQKLGVVLSDGTREPNA